MGRVIDLAARAPKAWRVAAEGETLAEAVERYLTMLAGVKALGTVKTYRQRLSVVLEVLGPETRVRTIRLPDLERLLTAYRTGGGGRDKNTVAHLYSVVNGFLDWCYDVELIDHRPHERWRGPGRTKPKPRGLSREQLIALLRQLVGAEAATWQDLRNETLVWMMVTVGCRRAEAADLTWDRVDLQGGYVRLRGKGEKERMVPLLPPVLRRLQRLKALGPGTGAVFAAGQRSGRHFRHESLNMLFRRWIVERLGVAVTPHDLRHSFARLLRAEGVELDELQDLLGHENFQTTRLYYGKTPVEQLRMAVEKHPLLELLEELERNRGGQDGGAV